MSTLCTDMEGNEPAYQADRYKFHQTPPRYILLSGCVRDGFFPISEGFPNDSDSTADCKHAELHLIYSNGKYHHHQSLSVGLISTRNSDKNPLPFGRPYLLLHDQNQPLAFWNQLLKHVEHRTRNVKFWRQASRICQHESSTLAVPIMT